MNRLQGRPWAWIPPPPLSRTTWTLASYLSSAAFYCLQRLLPVPAGSAAGLVQRERQPDPAHGEALLGSVSGPQFCHCPWAGRSTRAQHPHTRSLPALRSDSRAIHGQGWAQTRHPSGFGGAPHSSSSPANSRTFTSITPSYCTSASLPPHPRPDSKDTCATCLEFYPRSAHFQGCLGLPSGQQEPVCCMLHADHVSLRRLSFSSLVPLPGTLLLTKPNTPSLPIRYRF